MHDGAPILAANCPRGHCRGERLKLFLQRLEPFGPALVFFEFLNVPRIVDMLPDFSQRVPVLVRFEIVDAQRCPLIPTGILTA
jgi:hypothetical protein